jgi:sugar lactone lactonase YvrE
MDIVKTGITLGESPRWHGGRLWYADWLAGDVIALDPETGASEVITHLDRFPFSIDWLPDGTLLIVCGRELRRLDGPYADLSALSERGYNELVVDGRGYAYVNNVDFEFPGGEFSPGFVAVVTPAGDVRKVADGLAFPNGMAVTADGSTLIVAESYAKCLTAFAIAADGSLSGRRVWADLGDGVPDGICVDAEGAVWYADVPNQCCKRVREGGEVLQTVELDRGGFACMLGGERLYVMAASWGGAAGLGEFGTTGQVLAVPAPAPAAGYP